MESQIVDLTSNSSGSQNASILRQLLTQPQQQQPLKTEQDRQQQPSTTPSQFSIQQQQQQSSSDLKFILLDENGFPPEKCALNAAGFD
ncbi:hypothetical protein J6590_105816 [Homalodisca vitripennis]|nr:hypothetical protein J6590_105816 [Homalodisca vitripennis]